MNVSLVCVYFWELKREDFEEHSLDDWFLAQLGGNTTVGFGIAVTALFVCYMLRNKWTMISKLVKEQGDAEKRLQMLQQSLTQRRVTYMEELTAMQKIMAQEVVFATRQESTEAR